MEESADSDAMAEKLQSANIACILLAAGRSARFGEACKLSAPFRGRRLGDHAVALLGSIPFGKHLVVERAGGYSAQVTRFQPVSVLDGQAGMAHSINCAMNALDGREPHAVMIALADMPLVTAEHIAALVDAFDLDDPDCIIASSAAGRRMPPALFGRTHFETLRNVSGDAGARDLLGLARAIDCEPAMLTDIDTAADAALALTLNPSRKGRGRLD